MLETDASVSGGNLSRLQPQASSRIVSSGSSGGPSQSFIACPIALCRKRPGEVEEAATHGRVVDRIIGVDQFDRFASPHWIGFERLDRRLGKAARDRRGAHRIHVVEEEGDRHIQDAAQLMQPARADAVGAPLVYLHLLEGKADRRAELLLAQPEHVAAQPNARTDLHVDRVGFVRFLATWPPYRSRYRHKFTRR